MLNFLLQQLYNFLNAIIGILPSGGTLPTEIHDAFTFLGGYVGLIDVFIPLTIMKWCLIFVFGIEIALFGFKSIKWIISHIPLIGGKGNHA